MKRRPPPTARPAYVNVHGKPIDLSDLVLGRTSAVEVEPPAPAADASVEAADLDTVFDALALAGCRRGKTWLLQFLRALPLRKARGTAFNASDVGVALQRLLSQGRIRSVEGRGYDLAPADRVEPLARLLRSELGATAWRAFAAASSSYASPSGEPRRPDLREDDEQIAFARLVIYGNADAATARRMLQTSWGREMGSQALGMALVTPLLPDRFDAIDPALRNELCLRLLEGWPPGSPLWQLLFPLLDAWATRTPQAVDARLRLAVADRRVHLGDLQGCEQLLATLPDNPNVPLLGAALLARQGRWREAADAFAAALKSLSKATQARRGIAPYRTLQWYLWSLLAQSDPAAWATAKKLATTESGSRAPAPVGWGLFAHAAAVRLGDATLDESAFRPRPRSTHDPQPDEDANTLILAAWLGHVPRAWTTQLLGPLLRGLHDADRPWKAGLVVQACERLGLTLPKVAQDLPPTPDLGFFGTAPEAWRDALAAIQALGSQPQVRAAGAAPATLLWRLRTDSIGRVAQLSAFELSTGARGAVKARRVSPLALKRQTRLDPRDAALARCVVEHPWNSRQAVLDRAGAAQALVGHPRVEFEGSPGEAVELSEALPQLEVRRHVADDGSEGFEFVLVDELLARTESDGDDDGGLDDDDEDLDLDALESAGSAAQLERWSAVRVLRDGPGRARLLRLTPAQRRVIALVSQRWVVPASAKEELDAALRVLAGHFQLHSDAEGGQEVPSEPRLHAQLLPQGQGLQLRLVVRPFGDHGPEAAPGRGRERVLTVQQGLSLQTRRRLDEEAAHLAAVLDALPELAGAEDGNGGWLLPDPEAALAVLERLPQLGAVAAVEWPRGKPVRVLPLREGALSLQVGSGRDWFGISGELQLDEQRVLRLEQLLALMAASRQGRFVALGEGEYLALTDQLRRQLSDLQAAAQAGADGLRVPAAAAAWLAETLDGTPLKGDARWADRLQQLAEAAALQPEPPAALQAELRAYQLEGYVWMSRLAHAGLGGCLADDMGLGKTVQTLALLLQRAAAGPALVLAPTSVCANWMAEAARFAPTLELHLYGPSDRDRLLASAAAPGQLVVASYALAHLDIERLAAVEWATLVLDEAQALKNAATQRARSVATLSAGFRLALSGTPVENRLSDLWSLMNLLNPGLLGSANRFGERFAQPIERDRDEAARQRLRRLVSPFLLRRTKAQVLHDLPPRTEIVHRVEPGAEEQAFLEAARRQAIARVAEASSGATPEQAAFHVLAELTRLRRAACDPRLVAPELALVGAKVQEFERLAQELVAGRHKALVFSQFTDFLRLLAERLLAAGIAHQYLDGSTPAAARAERVAAFQRGEGDLFLISLKAGGFGLNLTAADYVIIVDPWWNPAAEDQAMGRAHRIGQQRPVTVYRLVTAGSIEERIVALHADKRSLADGILAGQDEARPVDAQLLKELLEEA